MPELGMGAVGEDGVRVLDPEVMRACRVTEDDLAAVQARERALAEVTLALEEQELADSARLRLAAGRTGGPAPA